MSQTPAERELAELLVESLNLEDVEPGEIDPEAPLFNSGLGLDSIDALELSLASAVRASRTELGTATTTAGKHASTPYTSMSASSSMGRMHVSCSVYTRTSESREHSVRRSVMTMPTYESITGPPPSPC